MQQATAMKWKQWTRKLIWQTKKLMMWTAEKQILNEDMIVAVVIAI